MGRAIIPRSEKVDQGAEEGRTLPEPISSCPGPNKVGLTTICLEERCAMRTAPAARLPDRFLSIGVILADWFRFGSLDAHF